MRKQMGGGGPLHSADTIKTSPRFIVVGTYILANLAGSIKCQICTCYIVVI